MRRFILVVEIVAFLGLFTGIGILAYQLADRGNELESVQRELAFEGFGQLSRLQRDELTDALVKSVVSLSRHLGVTHIDREGRSMDTAIKIDHDTGNVTVSITACKPPFICPEDFQSPFSMTFVQ